MTQRKLILRNLLFFWRTNLAIVGGVAVAVAVLAGALLVGQSVRGSLRTLLYERIGSTEYAVTSDRFFRENLASAVASSGGNCPIIYLKGTVVREETGVRAHDVNVYGVDERFWKFHGAPLPGTAENRSAVVGESLATQIGISTGDDLLLQVEKQQAIPREWLYGQRDLVGRTIRLNCRTVLPASGLGEFALRPSQGNVLTIFVPLKRLQRDLEQPGRVNAVLLSGVPASGSNGSNAILKKLKEACTLEDLGLKLRNLPSGRGFSLESSRILLEDSVANAALQSAAEIGVQSAPVFTYLANSIRANACEIPYSVITAADLGKGAMTSIKPIGSTPQPESQPAPDESIWLTDWAAKDLGTSIGDSIEIKYYLWQNSGRLVTRTAQFKLAGVVPTSGDVDASLAPEIPGVTDSATISGWDPPFPLDLGRIRPEDEDFWNRYRATPKAFITLARGQGLWESRFGKLTGIRFSVPGAAALPQARQKFAAALLRRLNPQEAGFALNAVREQGLAASRGSTDFGQYFAYFSSFLIAAAILLSVLVFKLMVEQRAREIGILRASGFQIRKIRRMFLIEGIWLSFAGSSLGILGALGYGWLMVFGLRTWWSGAVGTSRLQLHLSRTALLAGALAGILVGVLAIVWTLRALRHNSPRMLLAGELEPAAQQARRARWLGTVAVVSLAIAALLLFSSSSGRVPQMEGFFGSGFLLLISILCATALYLRRKNPAPVRGTGWPAFLRLGLRNAMHRPGRSLVCAALIASATFIIVSMEAFRLDNPISLDRKSGTGGYPLLAESALPIVHDLNTAEGREAVGATDLKNIRFVPFRERPGDDASCLNLYAPQEPKILGAPREFLHEARFEFQSSLASREGGENNPWLLLESSPDDPVIPAIADANTIQYTLHLSLGSEITVHGSEGKPVRLRLAAALRDSIFQGELLISESNFLRAFPNHQGYRFFLIAVPHQDAGTVATQLREALSESGLNVESSQERLRAYHRVENTYLSTFQSLGALGLILGTMGLAAILLRNVLERRKELALLRAVGFPRRVLSGIIVSENVFLMLWGLAAGAVCAFIAIIPALQSRGASFPFAAAGLVLIAVIVAGLVSSILAVIAALRSPLLDSLQSE